MPEKKNSQNIPHKKRYSDDNYKYFSDHVSFVGSGFVFNFIFFNILFLMLKLTVTFMAKQVIDIWS